LRTLARVAIPRVEHVVAERKNRMSGDLLKAKKARDEAANQKVIHDAEISSARTSAQAMFRASREKLDIDLAEKRNSLDRDIADKLLKAEHEIQIFSQNASTQIGDVAKDLVKDIVYELARIDVSDVEVTRTLQDISKEK